MGFLLAGELARLTRTGTLREGRLQAVLDEALAPAPHGRAAHLQGDGHRLIGPALRGLEPKAGSRHAAGGGGTAPNPVQPVLALLQS